MEEEEEEEEKVCTPTYQAVADQEAKAAKEGNQQQTI